jgi:pyrimidine operon attenuation protein / uracil phosphoribosyltransferase
MTPAKLPDVQSLLQTLVAAIGTPAPGTVIIGIHTGGAWVAERLAPLLPGKPQYGTLAVSLHRDDYELRGVPRQTHATRIPADINGRPVILVDDVIASGRTVRAALNELFDFGRPASVKFACLADRGGRELPFAPDYCAIKIDVPAGEELVLARDGDRLVLTFHTL